MPHAEKDPANLAMIERMIGAAGRRAAGRDPDVITRLAGLHRAVDEALAVAVAGQRACGITWASIGEALGVSKEAVVQRWGPSGSAVRRAG